MYSAGSGLFLSGTTFSIPSDGVVTSMIQDSAVTPAKVANRTRKVMIPSSAFAPSVASTFDINAGAAATRRIRGTRFGNQNANEYATTYFVVPSDYASSGVSGLNAPRITILWATDSPTGDNKINVDVMWDNITNFSSNTSAGTFRYNFRSGAGAATDASESLDPAQGQVVSQVIPESGEVWVGNPSWAAGDVIAFTIHRNGGAGDDPNDARTAVIGITFEYEADQ